MTEVITIKFRGRGKAYFFDPAGVTAAPGEQLVVETSKGMELGTVLEGNHMVEDSDTVQPLRPVVRKALPTTCGWRTSTAPGRRRPSTSART